MSKSAYPLSFPSWQEEEIAALHGVIQSGQFTMGQQVREFELAYAKYFQRKYALMVNSGSSANLLSIASIFHRKNAKLQAGDEVIVPAIAWSTTYAPLWQHGLKLRVVDIDLNTLNIDIDAVKNAITPKTRMIVGVSILGNPAPLLELKSIAEEKNLIFFEDNCESIGARLNNICTGNFGLLSSSSFFYAHHISTMEGGMILTDDRELFELAHSMRAHGWTRGLPEDSLLFERHSDSFSEEYRFILPGYNLRPLEFSAATGKCQLLKLDEMVKHRRKNAAYFREKMQEDPRYLLQVENGESSWYCFTIIVNPEAKLSRAEVLTYLREHKIEFRMITGGNIMRHEYAKKMNASAAGPLLNADIVHDRGFFVGNAPFDIRKEIDLVVDVLRKI